MLKFWGTRGSCAVSGAEYAHFGGNTCCLELEYDGTKIIFDAGTGIRPLGLQLENQTHIDLFLSHLHWDHTIGLPFFEPIYREGMKITLWHPKGVRKSGRDLFKQIIGHEFFPVDIDEVQSGFSFRHIEKGKPVKIGPITIDFHPTLHPNHTLCFRIQTPKEVICYVTDNELDLKKQASLVDFLKKSDLLVHEAQYFSEEYLKRKGWGHSSLNTTIELVEKIQPKHWLITHHDPKHSDKDLFALEKSAREKTLVPLDCIPDGFVWKLK